MPQIPNSTAAFPRGSFFPHPSSVSFFKLPTPRLSADGKLLPQHPPEQGQGPLLLGGVGKPKFHPGTFYAALLSNICFHLDFFYGYAPSLQQPGKGAFQFRLHGGLGLLLHIGT